MQSPRWAKRCYAAVAAGRATSSLSSMIERFWHGIGLSQHSASQLSAGRRGACIFKFYKEEILRGGESRESLKADRTGFHCGNVRTNGRRCGAAKRKGARILPSLDLRAAIPDHLPVPVSLRLLGVARELGKDLCPGLCNFDFNFIFFLFRSRFISPRLASFSISLGDLDAVAARCGSN